jgi:NAD(P)-dependent dehydrogenase (short-subunit alcohol dehydrogenase family)
MKIIVIGGKGTIGSAVVKELSSRHEILIAGRKNGDLTCDITSEESIRHMFMQAGKFDALVATTGTVHFEDLSKMNLAKYHIGLKDKLMGQVSLVLIGLEYIQDKGSFTLTSGVLSHDPIRTGSSASMVNSAVDGFVRGAAIEMPRQIRINAVSPTVIVESMDMYGSYFRGFDPIPVAKVALAYSKSVEGLQTGQIYEVLK